MYVYALGVIEKHGTGDTNDVFVCEHRGDMNRLAARLGTLESENAKLRAQLAEAVELLDRLNYTFLPPHDTEAISQFVERYRDITHDNPDA